MSRKRDENVGFRFNWDSMVRCVRNPRTCNGELYDQ